MLIYLSLRGCGRPLVRSRDRVTSNPPRAVRARSPSPGTTSEQPTNSPKAVSTIYRFPTGLVIKNAHIGNVTESVAEVAIRL